MEGEKNEDEIIAKSGESGLYGNVEDKGPWSSGEIKQLKAKWLQQELEEEVANEKDSESSSLIVSLSRRRLSNSGKFSRSTTRSSHSSHGRGVEEAIIDIDLGAHKRELPTFLDEPAISSLADVPSTLEFKDKKDRRQRFMEYFDILAHLAFFGIIGVLIRYGLEVLFDKVLLVTHEATIVYRDLPANMVGSFFMGWVGIIFKENIRSLSEPLALGLSTGLMGSITTYAGWNQKMVVLLTNGNVAASLAGLLLGMYAALTSLVVGIDSAKGLQLTIAKKRMAAQEIPNNQVPLTTHGGIGSSVMTAFAAACSWVAVIVLLVRGRSSQELHILWLACVVAPPGVWMRWHLARFNGGGVRGRLKWLPLGTLLANLIGASLDGILGFLQLKMTNDTAVLLLGALQLGFVGCLSTVSTFVAEVYTMHVGRKRLKAYIYTSLTLILGLTLCIFLYSTPSWVLGYVKW